MRNAYLDKITHNTFCRSEPLVLSVFFFLMGIASGASFASIMPSQERSDVLDFVISYLSGTDSVAYPLPFLHSIALNIFSLTLMAICGCFAFGFFVCFLALTCKGMALGFVCGLLLKCFKLQGMLWIVTAVLPQNILIIPAFVLAGTFSIASSFSLISRRKRGEIKKNRLNETGPYILVYSFFSIIIILAGVIESLLFPIVL